jgi:hypothetical protein
MSLKIPMMKTLFASVLCVILQPLMINAQQPVAQSSAAQPPMPQPPKAFIDTTYHRPSGREIKLHDGDDLQSAINEAQPGDILLLDPGATFTGNFMVPPKKGDGWIYVETAGIDGVAQAGQRIPIAAASRLAKIETANALPAIWILPGASNYRFTGLEITPEAGGPRAYQLVNIDYLASQVEAQFHDWAKKLAPGLFKGDAFPKNIILDRCYIHGSDTQDVRQAVVANGINVAVIDSYISDIHDATLDSQGVLAYRTPGPLKIVNNFISSSTENILFGGAGGSANPYVPSDIEIRGNWLYKPLSWIPLTTGGHGKWSVKNQLEFKSGQRAIVTGNILENDWQSAQNGTSVLLTPRVADDQGGPNTVVDDIDIENNVIKNVNAGFAITEFDNNVKDNTWHAETRRIKIANNLILVRDERSPGGGRPTGVALGPEVQDVLFQHNTVQMISKAQCSTSFYFNSDQAWKWPPPRSYTTNIWILDNVLCKAPTGDWGGQGMEGLMNYMGAPHPLDPRFSGNVMGDSGGSFPKTNTVSKITYVDPAAGNFELASPKWTQTTDGKPAGIDMATLVAATGSDAAGKVAGTGGPSRK